MIMNNLLHNGAKYSISTEQWRESKIQFEIRNNLLPEGLKYEIQNQHRVVENE